MIGNHEEQHLEDVRRQMRDPDPAVWQEACRALASLALEWYGAHEEIRRLVTCPYGELRLRGVHALSHLAADRPQEVRGFFLECLAEPEVGADPVFADALFSLLSQLPSAVASHLLEDAADDPRDTVRAAAANALASWRGWRSGLLDELAADPSPDVRCALALSLASLADLPQAAATLERLAGAPEPYVRAFVAEVAGTTGPRAEQPRARRAAAPDPDDLAVTRGRFDARAMSHRLGSLLDAPECRPRLARRVEELFADHPHLVAEILYPLLDRPGVPSLLDQLSWMARDGAVSALCRALLATLRPGMERRDAHLCGLLEALEGQAGPQAEVFRGWVSDCARGAAAEGIDAIVRWACTVDAARYAPLIDFAGALQSCEDMAGLHQLLGQMASIFESIETTYAMPEQALVRMVAECWSDVLDQELQDQVSGVNS